MRTLNSSNFAAARSRHRGTVLILTMTLCFALAAIVLLLARKMSVEATAAANQVSVLQADEVERGAEQYVLNLFSTVVNGGLTPVAVMDNLTYTEDYFAGIPVGADINNPTGWFWILRPQYDEDDLPLFGLVDECSKIDLNWFGIPSSTPNPPAAGPTGATATAYVQGMMMLPNMTEDIASSMLDWRDTDDEPTDSLGSETTYYQALETPYPAKNKPYEHVEELLMVAGFTPSYLFGDGSAGPLGEYSTSNVSGVNSMDDPQLGRGMYDLLTTHGSAVAATGGGGGGGNTGTVGLINVNTAPRIVLQALLNSAGSDPTAADAIISYRQQNSINPGDGSVTWFQDALSASGASGAQALATRITGASQFYSADILAVSRNGRGFKRVRIIVDTSTVVAATGTDPAVPATIVSRRDITDKGWPLSPQVLDSIRQTGTLTSTGVGGFGNTMGGTLR